MDSQRKRMQRLRTWDERFRTRDHKDRNLKQALGEIQRMGSALGLSDEVSEVADVSNVTIRNRYQELLEVYEDSQS